MNKEKKLGRIKSAVRRWLGVPISLTDGEFWAAYAGGQSAAGKSVTVDKALQLSAVWSCVRLLSCPGLNWMHQPLTQPMGRSILWQDR